MFTMHNVDVVDKDTGLTIFASVNSISFPDMEYVQSGRLEPTSDIEITRAVLFDLADEWFQSMADVSSLGATNYKKNIVISDRANNQTITIKGAWPTRYSLTGSMVNTSLAFDSFEYEVVPGTMSTKQSSDFLKVPQDPKTMLLMLINRVQ